MKPSEIIKLQSCPVEELIPQISSQLGIQYTSDCRRQRLLLPPALGTGQLITYASPSGVEAFMVDARLTKNFVLRFSGNFPAPMTAYTMAAGSVFVTSPEYSFTVRALQGTLHGGFAQETYQWAFSDEKPVSALIIFIQKSIFLRRVNCETLDLPTRIARVLATLETVEETFLYQEIYHLPVVDTVHAILAQPDTGLLNTTYAAAKIQENLYLQLNEFKQAFDGRKQQRVRDLDRLALIQRAEKILLSRLQAPPTIVALSRMVGINQQSLKQGFRQVYGESINRYLNERRMEQAIMLMESGRLSLREIAQTVGYSNPGYFSKRFKDKYGVEPSNFMRNQRRERG